MTDEPKKESEQAPAPTPSPAQAPAGGGAPPGPAFDAKAFWERMGLGPKILFASSAAMVILCFFPWFGASGVVSFNALNSTEGTLAFIVAIGCAASPFLLGKVNDEKLRKNISVGLLIGAGIAALLVVIVFFRGWGALMIGAYLGLVAALGMAGGAFLTAKEQKIF